MSKNALCAWDFTLPAECLNLSELKEFLKEHCKSWCFQKEKGADTGYLHWQGRVSLKVKARKGPTLEKCHWSPTSTENKDNDFYVMKGDTRVEGPWSDKDIYIPRQTRDITLRPWQLQVLADKGVWDTRTINCIICPKGNIGKSTLVTYAGARGLARKIPMLESYKDFMRMVMDCPTNDLYLVDFPRSLNKTNCGGFWSAIETVKDGYAYDDRYGFREKYFDCPNIWVFTNTEPDTTMLSNDRWVFWNVSESGDLHKALRCNNNYVAPGTPGTNEVLTEVAVCKCCNPMMCSCEVDYQRDRLNGHCRAV